MKNWQKYWLYFIIFYSILHLTRDIFQDLGIKNILSTVLVKYPYSKSSIYWQVFNTYVFEISEIVLSIIILKRNKFDRLGYSTIIIALIIFLAWLCFWLFL